VLRKRERIDIFDKLDDEQCDTLAAKISTFNDLCNLRYIADSEQERCDPTERIDHHALTNPELSETDRLKSNLAALARNSSRDVAEVTEEIRTANPTRRFGHPDEFGATCAFLCSAQAGYITGQNILIDGGAFPGTV
jgi:hypothetical protein